MRTGFKCCKKTNVVPLPFSGGEIEWGGLVGCWRYRC
jgi:hypothetical protein